MENQDDQHNTLGWRKLVLLATTFSPAFSYASDNKAPPKTTSESTATLLSVISGEFNANGDSICSSLEDVGMIVLGVFRSFVPFLPDVVTHEQIKTKSQEELLNTLQN